MFNWVVKVVPQPPDGPGTLGENKPTEKILKEEPTKKEEEQNSESSTQSGVLTWLSNGFVSSLPQPASSPLLSRASPDVGPQSTGGEQDRNVVIGWIAQNLGKMVPQPEEKYKQETPKEDTTEVYEAHELPDAEPLPHIPVVELVSDDEVSELEKAQFSAKMTDWLKQALPRGPSPGHTEAEVKRSSLDTLLSLPPSLSGAEDNSTSSNVVGWFVQGLGLKMPQLVSRPRDDVGLSKDDPGGAAEVQQAASSQPKPSDLVLEEVVEADWEVKNQEAQSKEAPPPPEPAPTEPTPVEQPIQSQPPARDIPEPTETPQEDAETQTDRWTPIIDNIRREAEDMALATMEERLMQERQEMVRRAEEVARQTAEMTIRQMAENQSLRPSIQSQDLLEEATVDLELHALREKESEEELKMTECQVCPIEEEPAKATGAAPPSESDKSDEEEPEEEEPESSGASPSPPPVPAKQESVAEPVPVEPTSQHEPEPITKQPQKAEDGTTENTGAKEEAETADQGCGSPVSCDAVKSCLMRLPLAPESLGACNALLKSTSISIPKVPPMPKFPTQLSEITQRLPSLPPELREEFSRIGRRYTRYPRELSEEISLQWSQLPQQFPGLSELSNLSQHLSDLPQKARKYYLNVQNRLNSLKPQDA